jgi:RNA 3'-terminal phosphate cyclase
MLAQMKLSVAGISKSELVNDHVARRTVEGFASQLRLA